jgi:hypothetical protein
MTGRIAPIAVVLALLLGVATAAVAAPPEGKGKNALMLSGSCWVDGTVVHATGLPSDEVINFWITNPDGGHDGWVLGHSSWWNVSVPERTGSTLYQFISRQMGKEGKQFTVFAECWGS